MMADPYDISYDVFIRGPLRDRAERQRQDETVLQTDVGTAGSDLRDTRVAGPSFWRGAWEGAQ